MCGDCQRLPLSSCGCAFAEDLRADLRGELAAGRSVPQIQADYRTRFGAAAISLPTDSGLDRALWVVPLSGLALALGVLLAVGRRWQRRGTRDLATDTSETKGEGKNTREYDDRLDDELRRFEDR